MGPGRAGWARIEAGRTWRAWAKAGRIARARGGSRVAWPVGAEPTRRVQRDLLEAALSWWARWPAGRAGRRDRWARRPAGGAGLRGWWRGGRAVRGRPVVIAVALLILAEWPRSRVGGRATVAGGWVAGRGAGVVSGPSPVTRSRRRAGGGAVRRVRYRSTRRVDGGRNDHSLRVRHRGGACGRGWRHRAPRWRAVAGWLGRGRPPGRRAGGGPGGGRAGGGRARDRWAGDRWPRNSRAGDGRPGDGSPGGAGHLGAGSLGVGARGPGSLGAGARGPGSLGVGARGVGWLGSGRVGPRCVGSGRAWLRARRGGRPGARGAAIGLAAPALSPRKRSHSNDRRHRHRGSHPRQVSGRLRPAAAPGRRAARGGRGHPGRAPGGRPPRRPPRRTGRSCRRPRPASPR